MPVSSTKLRKAEVIFTKQDYLDGKCTKDGMPLHGKGETKIDPNPPSTPSLEPVFVAEPEETSTATVDEGVDVTVDNTVNDNPEVVEEPKKEIGNGSSDDSPEQPVDTDEGDDSDPND